MTKRAREPFYGLGMLIARGLFRFLRVRRTVHGLSNLPVEGGAVLAITHFGYFEFALVGWVLWLTRDRPIRFLATRSAFDRPLVGAILRSAGQIPVAVGAGADAYATATAALRDGEMIGVFPEAAVDVSYTVHELKTGAVRLAREAGVPLIPIAVWGGQRLLTKNHKIRFRERFGVPVVFEIGEPVSTPGEAHEATAVLRERLRGLLSTAQASYPDSGVGAWWQPKHLAGTALTPTEAVALDARIAAAKAERRANRDGRSDA